MPALVKDKVFLRPVGWQCSNWKWPGSMGCFRLLGTHRQELAILVFQIRTILQILVWCLRSHRLTLNYLAQYRNQLCSQTHSQLLFQLFSLFSAQTALISYCFKLKCFLPLWMFPSEWRLQFKACQYPLTCSLLQDQGQCCV